MIFNKKKKMEIDEDVNMQDEESDIYSNYANSENEINGENTNDQTVQSNNNLSQNTNNINNSTNENASNGQAYVEKVYKTGTLEEHTQVTKASAISRVILFGFYGLFIVLGVLAYFLIRSNKYEFYLEKESVLIDTGSTYQIELIPKNERYFDYLNYDYSIADEDIATVDEFGTITAKSSGTTTLKISLKRGFLNKTVRIVSESINIESVNIAIADEGNTQIADSVNMTKNQSITLRAIVNNRDDLNVSATYKSSDMSVATVDNFGNVTARAPGTATITGIINGVEGYITVHVTSGDNEETYDPTKPTARPVVTPRPTSKPSSATTKPGNPTAKPTPKSNVSLGVASQVTKYINEELQLSAKYGNKAVKNSDVKWTSSNPKIATISSTGLIKCKAVGTTTITAEINGEKGTTKLVVKQKPAPATPTPSSKATPSGGGSSAPSGTQFLKNNVQLNKTSLTVKKGSTQKFTITVNKSIATMAIKSSDEKIAKVSVTSSLCNTTQMMCMLDSVYDNADSGKATLEVTVTGVSAGKATISVTIDELIDANEKEVSGIGTGKVGILVQ